MRSIFIVPLVVIILALMGCSLSTLVMVYSILGCLTVLAIVWIERMVRGSIKMVIFCPECGDSIALTPYNHFPEYVGDKEILKDDLGDYIGAHSEHTLSYLSLVLGPWRQKRVPWEEPIGQKVYLARRNSVFRAPFLIIRKMIDIKRGAEYRSFRVWCLGDIFLCLRQVKPQETETCPGCGNSVIRGAKICGVCGFNMNAD